VAVGGRESELGRRADHPSGRSSACAAGCEETLARRRRYERANLERRRKHIATPGLTSSAEFESLAEAEPRARPGPRRAAACSGTFELESHQNDSASRRGRRQWQRRLILRALGRVLARQLAPCAVLRCGQGDVGARECGTNEICQRLTRLVASEAPAEAQSTGATGAGGGQTASATGCFETSAEALGENSEEKEGNSGDAGASLSPRSCLLRRRGLGRFLGRVALRPFSTTVMSARKTTKFPKNDAAWEVEHGGSG
jgi:hypothetical protein